jgi:hypothetical protein
MKHTQVTRCLIQIFWTPPLPDSSTEDWEADEQIMLIFQDKADHDYMQSY